MFNQTTKPNMFSKLLSISFLGLVLSQIASATVITSLSTGGNWNQASTWVGGIAPGPEDTVRIIGGSNITVSTNASIKRIVYVTDTTNSTISLNSGVSMTITGQLVFGAPSRNNRNFIFNIDAGSAVIEQVQYINTGDDTRRSIIRISTGSLIVNGTFDMNVERNQLSRRRLEIIGNGSATFNGLVLNPATITAADGSTVSYLANGNLGLLFGDYHHLNISGTGIKTIGSGTVVNGKAKIGGGMELTLAANIAFRDSLIMNGAVINQNNFNIILRGNYALAGNFGAANHFNQNGTGLLQIIGDSASRYLGIFPLGANGQYAPFTVTRLAANFPGNPGQRNMEIRTFGFRHPLLTGADNAAKRFWRIRTNNITVVTKFGATFNYGDADVATPIDEASLTSAARLRSAGWQVAFSGSSVNQANNQLLVDTTNNLIDGDYTFGQAAAFPNSFPFVYSVRNGEWATAGNWSSNAAPTTTTDILVLHNIDAASGSVNNVEVASMGNLSASSTNLLINGSLTVSGRFNDAHSGGANTVLGKTTVNNGGIFNGTGSGGGTSFNFANDIENNGTWSVGVGTIRFTRQVKNVLKVSGSQPINFTNGNGRIFSQVDTLILNQGGTAISPSIIDPTFIVGDSNYNFNCTVLNKSAVNFNVVTSRPTTNFIRKFIQGQNAYAGFRSGTPFSGTTGTLDFLAQGNTVDYNLGGGSQTIPAIDHFNVVMNSDRFDRFKTLAPGNDVTFFGDMTVNSNANTFQFANISNGQKLTIKGNLELKGSARVQTSSGGKVRNKLVLEGKFINNSNASPGVNLRVSDTTFTDLVMSGTGRIAEGSGSYKLQNLTLTGTDTVKWAGTGLLEIGDTLTNNALAFHQSQGTFFVPTNARFTFKGSSPSTRFKNILFADRGDRNISVFQKINLRVDSLFHMQADGRTSLGAFYDFGGKVLEIRGIYRVSSNGGTTAMRPDSTSTLIFEGDSTASSLIFATNFRKLGLLVHNKGAKPLAIGGPVTIHKGLDMFRGNMTGTTNLRLVAGATVRRTNGSIASAFNNQSGKYNLEYWSNLTSGPEATSIPAINKLTIRAAENDTITFANSPTLDSNLVYLSGKMKANGNNYVRLGANSFVEISGPAPQTTYPVGTLTAPSFIGADVSSLTSGKLLLKPYRAFAPNIPTDANVRLNRYVEASGNATGLLYTLGFSYADADVTGGPESSLTANFWNGADWNDIGGLVETNQNGVLKGGLTSNGILSAFGTFVSVKNVLNSDIQVFPNPTKDKVVIRTTENYEVAGLKDILGKEVKLTWSVTSQGIQLDMSRLVDGIYFLHLKGENKNEILRLVKHQ